MKTRRARAGLTTLEILVTVAIAGVFASMAVMNMDIVKRRQSERNALREISSLANQARTYARTSQYPVRLSVATNVMGSTVLRWEQLPCDTAHRWGDACPATACLTNACGKGGCECVAQGEGIAIPATLDVSALNGLCWLGRGGAPRYQAPGSPTCQATGQPPQTVLRITQSQSGKLDHVLQVDGLTGKPRMVDCTQQPVDPTCSIQ
ncbi:prepilin-type methylation domain protein [Cystobacter fuscus DSM 2262]|uniref:Prepilin-type methylation domain protein n=1 Tax=Cystobacter fuscus (strain ATCC 25194 / DSM 2262 / NBRC 100088 / M29) TaxID=1242864 RepID=S9P0K3_CYSF2|nr:hypothetical protein [Cystobacter fuscus]EPX56606.1 prepilin-type methylation domain protein [Cystobacter fuscus DSM 2262]